MTRPILTRSIYLRLAAAVLVTAAIFGGLALKAAASRGELLVLQWGGER